jgi:predicted  nucleic acid-binding Zn-ribbon protein
MDRDNEITSLIQEIELAREKISALESDIVQAENKNAALKNEIDTINENFTRTYSQINDLVILAGYNSGDDFLNLAKDIVYVNNNIKELNEKIETLREAMALFVNK